MVRHVARRKLGHLSAFRCRLHQAGDQPRSSNRIGKLHVGYCSACRLSQTPGLLFLADHRKLGGVDRAIFVANLRPPAGNGRVSARPRHQGRWRAGDVRQGNPVHGRRGVHAERAGASVARSARPRVRSGSAEYSEFHHRLQSKAACWCSITQPLFSGAFL